MRKYRQAAALTIATVAAIAGTVTMSSPAMAASTPIGACGGGSYHQIDSHDLGAATIYLLYNGTTNCVVTWKDSPNSTYVLALISNGLDGWRYDDGDYSTYAGPVKVNGAGQCIKWGGAYGSTRYDSPWEHCG
ncbi:spore-associated protein A [Nonomuraea sp. B12E4]|uniref:spore-associated protein A n=1 Tax=Nonomuraea sp. B12E4 TaxID=3153564 RepID=UPI00325D449E